VDRDAWLSALICDGGALGEAAGRAGLDAPVPSCPEWTVRDLVAHVGSVHRWVSGHVVRRVDSPPAPFTTLEPDTEPLRWLADGLAAVTRTLADLDPGTTAWNLSPSAPRVALFWSRRMAHEAAIHRWDAELAAGAAGTFEPGFAADGVGEVLDSLLARRAHREPLVSARGRVRVECTDTGDAWLVTLAAGEVGVRADDGAGGEPDATIRGPARDVYLRMWGRIPLDRVAVAGDRGLAEVVRTR
jgi:uncharacterized protein (TIGR03083 family)